MHSTPINKVYTYILDPTDGKLFNINRLHAVTKWREVMIKDLLFANNAVLLAHSEQKLQRLIDLYRMPAENLN